MSVWAQAQVAAKRAEAPATMPTMTSVSGTAAKIDQARATR